MTRGDQTNTRMIRALIVDVGVLIDEHARRELLAHVLAPFDMLPAPAPGLSLRDAIVASFREARREIEADELRRLTDRVQQATLRSLEERPLFAPGAAELVRDASSRVPLAALGREPRALTQALLKAGGVFDRFTAIVGAEEVGRPRPDPSGHRVALSLIDRDLTRHNRAPAPPRSTLAIEGCEDGVAAAREAGMKVLAIGFHTRRAGADDHAHGVSAVSLEETLEALF